MNDLRLYLTLPSRADSCLFLQVVPPTEQRRAPSPSRVCHPPSATRPAPQGAAPGITASPCRAGQTFRHRALHACDARPSPSQQPRSADGVEYMLCSCVSEACPVCTRRGCEHALPRPAACIALECKCHTKLCKNVPKNIFSAGLHLTVSGCCGQRVKVTSCIQSVLTFTLQNMQCVVCSLQL